MAQEKAAAGERNGRVHGADTAQRALEAGVLDELQIHTVLPGDRTSGAGSPVQRGEGVASVMLDSDGAAHLVQEFFGAAFHVLTCEDLHGRSEDRIINNRRL
jgi:hypothetical protein